MKKRQFKPTHRLSIGWGKSQTYLYVRIANKAGKKNGEQCYNVIASIYDKSGIHSVPMVPESRLERLNEIKSVSKEKQRLPIQGDDDWLSVQEVAEAMYVNGSTVRRWILNGALEAAILPRGTFRHSYLIKRSVINAILMEEKSKDANG